MKGGEQMRQWMVDARLAKGLTQAQAAKLLQITESYYCYIENGERQKKMDITLVARLSEVLGVPLNEIVAMEQANLLENKNTTDQG